MCRVSIETVAARMKELFDAKVVAITDGGRPSVLASKEHVRMSLLYMGVFVLHLWVLLNGVLQYVRVFLSLVSVHDDCGRMLICTYFSALIVLLLDRCPMQGCSSVSSRCTR